MWVLRAGCHLRARAREHRCAQMHADAPTRAGCKHVDTHADTHAQVHARTHTRTHPSPHTQTRTNTCREKGYQSRAGAGGLSAENMLRCARSAAHTTRLLSASSRPRRRSRRWLQRQTCTPLVARVRVWSRTAPSLFVSFALLFVVLSLSFVLLSLDKSQPTGRPGRRGEATPSDLSSPALEVHGRRPLPGVEQVDDEAVGNHLARARLND
eukprot:3934305-Rhodomonas_salina.2